MSAEPPFSRPFAVAELRPDGQAVTIEADAAERAALAGALDLRDIEWLKADLRIDPLDGGAIRVSGTVGARVGQTCVVTLEPMVNEVSESVDMSFKEGAEDLPMPEDEGEDMPDPPDPILDGTIDLGNLAAEHLALGLDPYPRKEGVRFEGMDTEPEEARSPFAALKSLRDKME